MHYYQFNIGDYAKHTRHLTMIEDLAYRRLLDFYYTTEKPLVLDIKKLSRFIGMVDHQSEISQVLEDFFDLTDEGFEQKRVIDEINKYTSKAESARENGKKGGRPKKQNKPKKTGLDNLANPAETGLDNLANPAETGLDNLANPAETGLDNLANPAETGSKANQEPRTINHKPITNNQQPQPQPQPKKSGGDDSNFYMMKELSALAVRYLGWNGNLSPGQAEQLRPLIEIFKKDVDHGFKAAAAANAKSIAYVIKAAGNAKKESGDEPNLFLIAMEKAKKNGTI